MSRPPRVRAWYRAFDQWRDRGRARRLRALARLCRKVAGNAERLADALDPDGSSK